MEDVGDCTVYYPFCLAFVNALFRFSEFAPNPNVTILEGHPLGGRVRVL